MRAARIAFVLLATALSILPFPGALKAMIATTFDGPRRIVIITADAPSAPLVSEQRAELLKHVAAMDERDMVAFMVWPDDRIEPVHGPAPKPSDVQAIVRQIRLADAQGRAPFAVLLIGKDGGVKLRSERPVAAPDLFALIDTMPMRRQEMKR